MATAVSCYYKIPSKHSHDKYDAWIENFMSLPMKTVIFVGDDSLPNKYPPTQTRRYIHLPIDQFYTKSADESKEKPFFMLYASQVNPYNTDDFKWVDINEEPLNIEKIPSFCKDKLLAIVKNPLRFCIVGPGIMPIPPTGWGAVEILIWDYAKTLEKLGYEVTIINTPDMDEAAARIIGLRPDVVHIQYDDHAGLCEKIYQHVKRIAITTHYGYLEQFNRWGPYANTFQRMIQQTTWPNVYHFTLSQGISEVYKKCGVPANRIILAPNGANPDLFQFHKDPQHLNRSICLGKIEDRKRQFLLQEIPDLYFAGNITDYRFQNSAQYLGEWTKDTLYKNLSHYGNLILLSDGEADPLVVKEALMCGLGVVISEWATANLDLTKKFITVIAEDKIRDLSYVAQKIRENREYCATHREEIYQYGLTFSWTTLIKKYIDNLNNIII